VPRHSCFVLRRVKGHVKRLGRLHVYAASSFSPHLFDFQYLILQNGSRFYLGIMNEEKHEETAALDETMVARIEIEEIGVAANEKEMTDSVTALPGVREVKIENGAMHVTYDPLATSEKKIEEAVRASGNTVKAATTDTETPHP
jgi:copper chaperone CopZ